ncbi:MAG: GNAT family N-acetyltransferase [Bacteroidetes bacterium]|nr:GNAT family N-acetyltransferase [Bacteroidota bacterium]
MTNRFQIVSASHGGDFFRIIQCVKQLMLDDIAMKPEQFLVAKVGTKVIGFGRIKVYPDTLELCSLGVLSEYRGRGIGKELVNELIKKANRQTVFLVCIIPDFFKCFGFEATDIYPDSLKPKINYCIGTLGGCDDGQEYVVMKRNAS